ncbi:glycogen debranching protein GlgX [Rhodococcus aerolatus]
MSPAPPALVPGEVFPLGSHPGPGGTRFAVASASATRVQVCLVSDGLDGRPVERRVDLLERDHGVWHGVVPGVGAGQRYGYRVDGPWDPSRGLHANPAKLLLDPWCRRVTGRLGDPAALLPGTPDGSRSTVDSLGHVPLSVVTAPGGPPTGTAPRHRWQDTVVYEAHVGSLTATHPDVPPEHRGRYLGLAAPAVLAHLQRLGVTAVELLPVQAFLDEPALRERGMRNHWGYSPAAYLAPHPGYATTPGQEVAEFRTMVAALHGAGLEVLLDVVYNHTCEGGADGPSVSFRGLDGPAYYARDAHGPRDVTGCGNTLDAGSPTVARLVLDSLRYWVTEMGVDGFRFDLAPTLGRPGAGAFDPHAGLLTAIAVDPVLSRAKLVAEPWDATAEGYQVGRFGPMWTEWNDRFRDGVRAFWAAPAGVRELASRLSGSSDLFAPGGRRPWASVNFVTAHDGFTARDLVSYARKHNEANGEDGRDGTDNNLSVDHGVEGPTDDPVVLAARARHVRALLATTLLATGTPMLLAGDELGHTQGGNNNAYCAPVGADAPWSLDWACVDDALTAFVARAAALRRAAPALRQPEFFEGRDTPSGRPDLVWFGADGRELTDAGWHDDTRTTLQMWVDGSDVRTPDAHGEHMTDASWLLVLHSGPTAEVVLADVGSLVPVLTTTTPDGVPEDPAAVPGGSTVTLGPATLLVLRVAWGGATPA